jgi:integrase
VKHISDWEADLVAQGFTSKHAAHTSNRVRRLVAVMFGSPTSLVDHRRLDPSERGSVARNITSAIAPARLSDLDRPKVQDAIAKLRDTGWSLQTCNHYRAAIRAFSRWCYNADRTRDDLLHGLKGFNAKEDPRHERRTVSLEELRRLIGTAERGPEVMRVHGPVRSLCYRLAVSTGLRFSELRSIEPESFNWTVPSVTVPACYTKNS